MKENLLYGRYCQSGMAVIKASTNEMQCVKIDSVKTNVDNYGSSMASPFKCKLDTISDACKYYYKGADT